MYQTTACPAVAPKRVSRIRFQFSQPLRASVSGAFDVFPSALSVAKMGDSFIFIRT